MERNFHERPVSQISGSLGLKSCVAADLLSGRISNSLTQERLGSKSFRRLLTRMFPSTHVLVHFVLRIWTDAAHLCCGTVVQEAGPPPRALTWQVHSSPSRKHVWTRSDLHLKWLLRSWYRWAHTSWKNFEHFFDVFTDLKYAPLHEALIPNSIHPTHRHETYLTWRSILEKWEKTSAAAGACWPPRMIMEPGCWSLENLVSIFMHLNSSLLMEQT